MPLVDCAALGLADANVRAREKTLMIVQSQACGGYMTAVFAGN